jgi:hypothetical protein
MSVDIISNVRTMGIPKVMQQFFKKKEEKKRRKIKAKMASRWCQSQYQPPRDLCPPVVQ